MGYLIMGVVCVEGAGRDGEDIRMTLTTELYNK